MGLTEMDEYATLDGETEKWWIALRTSPLKPIFTNKEHDGDQDEECCTTPTSQESRIPARLVCPPAPKKRKASSRPCNFNNNGGREFFNPPDLETVFIRRAEKA